MKKESADNWFYVSRREANGYVLLLILVLLSILFPLIFKWMGKQADVFSEEDIRKLDSIRSVVMKETKTDQPIEYANFDPNTISKDGLVLLGFSEKIARRIENYRSKGGRFIHKEDLMKIYDMDSSFYLKIFNYIDLPPRNATSSTLGSNFLDINKVNLEDLRRIEGIGTMYAHRILDFREKLGGYIDEDQYEEVYGLDSALIEKLKTVTYIAQHFIPRKININNSTKAELENHPYISRALSNDIEQFRSLNGSIIDSIQIKSFKLVTEPQFEKLFPYLEF